MIVHAVRQWIWANPNIAPRLAVWTFDAVRPAVFDSDVVPEGVPSPNIALYQDGEKDPFNHRAGPGSGCAVVAMLWGDRDGSHTGLRQIANQLWMDFYRAQPSDLDVPGFVVAGTWASFPSFSRDNEGYPGYQVNLVVYVSPA